MENTIINYFQYLQLTYNDGSGQKDSNIKALVADLFDDEICALAEAIDGNFSVINNCGQVVKKSPEAVLLQMLPEYYHIERFY